MFSGYQQVEGGAASDGNGFDRPPEFKGVPTQQAAPRTLILSGGDTFSFFIKSLLLRLWKFLPTLFG